MSEAEVNTARMAYAAFNRGGVDAILDFLDPEIEWRMYEQFTRESRVYRGHSGAREVLNVFEENFDDFKAEPLEFIDVSDRVVVPVRLTGRAKGSGEEATFELVHVWTNRSSPGEAVLASKLDVYSTKEEALESLGVEADD